MSRARFAVLLLPFLLAGCGFFSRQEKQYFSLQTVPSAAPRSLTGLPVGIDSVELPPPVDRREIVVRQENGQLDLRGTELWSAPLESMVVHTLAFDLAARLPEGMVVLPGQAKPIGAMRSVYVVFETLEAGPEPRFVLDARWILKEPGKSDVTRHEQVTVDLASLDSSEIATAMTGALGILTDRIAAGL